MSHLVLQMYQDHICMTLRSQLLADILSFWHSVTIGAWYVCQKWPPRGSYLCLISNGCGYPRSNFFSQFPCLSCMPRLRSACLTLPVYLVSSSQVSLAQAHGGGRSRKKTFLKTLKTQQHGSGPNLNASKEYRSRSPQSTVHTAFFVGISTRDVLNTETSAVDPHSYVIFWASSTKTGDEGEAQVIHSPSSPYHPVVRLYHTLTKWRTITLFEVHQWHLLRSLVCCYVLQPWFSSWSYVLLHAPFVTETNLFGVYIGICAPSPPAFAFSWHVNTIHRSHRRLGTKYLSSTLLRLDAPPTLECLDLRALDAALVIISAQRYLACRGFSPLNHISPKVNRRCLPVQEFCF